MGKRPLIPPHKVHKSKTDYNRKREKQLLFRHSVLKPTDKPGVYKQSVHFGYLEVPTDCPFDDEETDEQGKSKA